MPRIGVTDYTILGTVKGAELELLRFTHPFMGFDVLAILGDHVTLDAGTGAVHTAPGHGPDDYVIGQKYGLETANPVGPDGTYLPGTYPTLDGVNVFKANDIVVALLQEKGDVYKRQDLILAKVQLPNVFYMDNSKAEEYALLAFFCQWICANKRR